MTNISVPRRVEETSVTFIGFPREQSELFRTFVWELVAGTEPAMESGLRGAWRPSLGSNLTELVGLALNFRAVAKRSTKVYGSTPFDFFNFDVIETSGGFTVYPISEPRRLKTASFLGGIVYSEFSFLYGGTPRKVRASKRLPWGLRGLTKDGYRNFRWDKMAVMPVELPNSAFTVKIKSESTGGSGKLYLWAESSAASKSPNAFYPLREVVLFDKKRIVSPDTVLRRQNHETPPGA